MKKITINDFFVTLNDERLFTDTSLLDWEFYLAKNNTIVLNSDKFQRKPKSLFRAIMGYLNA